jgi:hypothetical protein
LDSTCKGFKLCFKKATQNTKNRLSQNKSTTYFTTLLKMLSKKPVKTFFIMGKDLSGTIMLYLQGNLNANSR